MTVHPTQNRVLRQRPPSINETAERATGAALMTAASLRQLREELDRLRRRTRVEIAQRLREARAYGDGSNNDEYHAVREEQLVLEARMASLEDTIEAAVVIDPDEYRRGAVVIGSVMLLEDLSSGAMRQYRLTSSHDSIAPDTITAASPMGRALLGATPGTVVAVELPSGQSRGVRLLEVRHEHEQQGLSAGVATLS
jgi:transcription elongation factor GreA